MKYNLADICEYAKGKVDVAILDDETYISTENMIPTKGGITSASSLPTIAQTQAFLAGDVWALYLPNMLAMLVIGGLFFGIATLKTRKSLDI